MRTEALAATEANRLVWDGIYASGGGVMTYPSEALVRLAARELDAESHPRLLDLGFGSGANLVHLARAGFTCRGVEVSHSAALAVQARLRAVGLAGHILLGMGQALPFADGSFDAVVAWLVLYYADAEGAARSVAEIRRVLRPGGKVVATLARPDDVLATCSEPIGEGVFRVDARVPSQEGAVILVARDEADARRFFEGFARVDVGWFASRIGGTTSAHWIISAER